MSEAIETERLTLRRFTDADCASIVAAVGDFDVARWLTRVPHPYTEAHGADFITRMGDQPLVFCVQADEQVVGCMSIDGELGYWFAKAHWGRGFATEAARAAVDAYFATTGDALQSGYVLGNNASRNVLAKLGFIDVGRDEVNSASLQTSVHRQRMLLTADRWKQTP